MISMGDVLFSPHVEALCAKTRIGEFREGEFSDAISMFAALRRKPYGAVALSEGFQILSQCFTLLLNCVVFFILLK